MNGFRRWLWRLRFFRHLHRRSYDRQAASEFLFERRSLVRSIVDERSGLAGQSNKRATMLVVGNPARYTATRREEFVLRGPEVPSLTITSDPSNSIAVVGTAGPDWKASFRAHGEGDSEREAEERVRAISIDVSGGTIALTGPNLDGPQGRGDLLVEGPTDAGVVVHGSYAYVEVLDMAGSVRVSATHARAQILDTSGQVDVTAGVIDFAGLRGRVTLSAEMEINLRMRSTQFEGTVRAWAQRSIRMLVPPGFATPIEAVVSRRARFVCRTELASRVRYRRQGELHIFSLGTENGTSPRQVLHLRSEEAAVVIDTGTSSQLK
jgi:hypothetical protein